MIDRTGRPVESASASTACQTNRSTFAYAITAVVLALGALFLFAILNLAAAVLTVSYDYQSSGFHDDASAWLLEESDLVGASHTDRHAGNPGATRAHDTDAARVA